MALVILTGASGSGKTVIARTFSTLYPGVAKTLFFDSIGVPASDEMIRQFGSGEEWQRSKTSQWMRLIEPELSAQSILFEGQMRLSFIHEAAKAEKIRDYTIMLIDCDDDTRKRRLTVDRGQPDLASADMMNWARHLREEARMSGDPIIDTTLLSIAEAVDIVRQSF